MVPPVCWSVATSVSSRQRFQLGEDFRRPLIELVEIGVLQRILEERAAGPPADVDVLRRLQEQSGAFDLARAVGPSRRMISVADALRSPSGFSVMNMRPLFWVWLPVAPTSMPTLATSGIAGNDLRPAPTAGATSQQMKYPATPPMCR